MSLPTEPDWKARALKAEAEAAHWKANHAVQVRRKRNLHRRYLELRRRYIELVCQGGCQP